MALALGPGRGLALCGGDENGPLGKGTQAARPGARVQERRETGGVVHRAQQVCPAHTEATRMTFSDVAQGTRARQAQAAELALGLPALSLPRPPPTCLPRPPTRPRPQPGYSCCRSEAWSLQENTGPPEPGFSVML